MKKRMQTQRKKRMAKMLLTDNKLRNPYPFALSPELQKSPLFFELLDILFFLCVGVLFFRPYIHIPLDKILAL